MLLLVGAGFLKFLQPQFVNHRFEIAWCAVAVEFVARLGIYVFPLGHLLFVFCFSESPFGDKMSRNGLDVFRKIFLQVPVIIAKATIADTGFLLAFGAICGRPGTARKWRAGKTADKGRTATLAVYAELISFPNAQECRESEIDPDDTACRLKNSWVDSRLLSGCPGITGNGLESSILMVAIGASLLESPLNIGLIICHKMTIKIHIFSKANPERLGNHYFHVGVH